jgi:ABC-type proline/glycine betaine transport system substrate-binding protein
MKEFIAIVGWSEITSITGVTETRLDKYADFNTQAEADAHVLLYNGFVVANPGGTPEYWIVDSGNKTVTNDQAQADADILERSWATLRTDRNALLVSSDWTQYNDSPLGDEAKASWITYRQELRNLPATVADPAESTWPEAPE